MKHRRCASIRPTRLTQALTLALGLSVTAVMAGSQPVTMNDYDKVEALYVNHFGSLEGFEDYMEALLPPVRSKGSQAVTATRYVSNCSNAGAGSFRVAVAAANSGDVIDLSGCDGIINLTSSVVTSVADLSIVSTNSIGTILDGGNTIRPLAHTGGGTLSLEKVIVRNGKIKDGVARGGCISSFGDVELSNSQVKYCEATRTTGTGVVRGGGIYAFNNVTLKEDSLVKGNKATTSVTGGTAFGGGVYARTVSINSSTISGNSATTLSGLAKGGGLSIGEANIGTERTTSTLVDSIISENKASVANDDIHAYGGGIFAKRTNLLISQTHFTDNTASKYGEGGGLFISNAAGNTQIKYSTFNGNEAKIGGGINSRSGIDMKYSTVADNSAEKSGGLVSTGGNVSLKNVTISGNTADHVAGARLRAGSGGTVVIAQSTISGNVAHLNPSTVSECPGVGLRVESNATINNSSIVFNVNDHGSATTTELCGGHGLRLGAGVSVTMSSTVLAHNITKRALGGTAESIASNLHGPASSILVGNHNAIGITPAFAVPADTIVILADHQPVNYQVASTLADNGGLTKTHRPRDWMPGIGSYGRLVGAGVTNGYENDQRGTGFPRVFGHGVDIGAIESIYQGVAPPNAIFKDGFE